ncbi:hypothetical protein SAMD00019534_003530 [Acytostelium subglobosum LB1]|uniref:hypothetical protein n=1 Tax=Acytostelium subglobosum LB1 TaxID=1410327 RepID=UPI000644B1F6|nr:hypothetical protein SAMD00019534_003530 [Acytostelium subglobosum LB1]GAM17178.1 hypothetical protein SAMD00019534_003530 [Acytostelium subglobosum LB1]|eukprot:XP_012759240.1 hypothetical protein SAMD00019534_003530 [Acytostelium subglobosum LB1]
MKSTSSSSSDKKEIVERSQLFLLRNAFNTDIEFTTKEMRNNVHWLRQIIAVLIGILFGLIPVKGLYGLAGFFIVNAGFTTIYYSKFLEVEDADTKWELFQEGFMPSFACFLVSWIISYNL